MIPVKYKHDTQYLAHVYKMLQILENNTEKEIGLVTPPQQW